MNKRFEIEKADLLDLIELLRLERPNDKDLYRLEMKAHRVRDIFEIEAVREQLAKVADRGPEELDFDKWN